MYYGRVLKYYLANNVKVSSDTINYIENWIKENLSTTNTYSNALLEQNLIASSLTISAYGATSDQEFFAESFAKWMLTPNDKKNLSWELYNTFFTQVFPALIKEGKVADDAEIEIKKIVELNTNKNSYNLSLGAKPTDGIDSLEYAGDIIGWQNTNYYKSAATSILEQVLSISNSLYYRNSISNYLKSQNGNNTLQDSISNWMYSSYIKASDESIKSFKDYNSNHFSSFESLDTFLQEKTVDKVGNKRIWLSDMYKSIEETYSKSIPTDKNNEYISSWTNDTTISLENVTLELYNYLYSLIGNEEWITKIIYGLVISPDDPLKSDTNEDMTGVLGYTATTAGELTAGGYTTVNSYIVICGSGLLIKDYNYQYKQGWFSSPTQFHVLVHEMGHAMDAFAAKVNDVRNLKNTQESNYSDLYPGEYFGTEVNKKSESTPVSKKESFTYVIGSVIGIMIAAGVIILGFALYKRSKGVRRA
ncbi:hypothetical protein SHELI_v1c07740 [Spiroplasma helicoides]|uniref:Uncharacterized protein n=2 Tax=Spiroplasma helicoides TaxID=216938 RepID=A0A1B3SLC5_9MOLU|nr:hypothetical protein SHELI_v1c07740 [Spiroplasma helicoides]